ncbi:MAG: hypothetical protein ABN482_10465 [Corticimicrobacter sp.]|uniref:hypothetical protein n=1 Tax=Corticimicrobacter sp. TaxID=2678536 RepID=UPI0032DAE056
MVAEDRKFSRGDLLEILEETADMSPDHHDEIDDDEGFDSGVEEPILAQADKIRDKHEMRVADLFRNLSFRGKLFGDAYPFQLNSDSQELRLLDFDEPARLLYLQLLISSSLRLVPKSRRHELTERFEILSTRIFECLMPQGWQVHRFGAKGAVRYKGRLFDRLKKLASDIRGQLLVESTDFKATNAGDGGLDIVAWHPLGDARIGIPIALAQCGCTAEEWSLKSLEASPSALGANLNTHHPWATYYFMPQDLVAQSGGEVNWQRRTHLTKSIVLDRIRLIKLADEYGVANECVNAQDLIIEASQLRHG